MIKCVQWRFRKASFHEKLKLHKGIRQVTKSLVTKSLCYKKEQSMLQKGHYGTKRNSQCYKKEQSMLQKGIVNVTKRTKPCYQKDTMLQKGPNNVTKRNIDLIVRSFVRSFCIRRVEIRYYVYSKHKIGLQPI